MHGLLSVVFYCLIPIWHNEIHKRLFGWEFKDQSVQLYLFFKMVTSTIPCDSIDDVIRSL